MEDYSAYTDEELIMRIHNDKNDHGDNNEIMDYILEKYKPLVRKKTNALYLIGGENDDLIQEGMIGLFKAVRDYKSDKEASFYSFAQLCITRQLSSALEASNRKKHMPLNTYISFSQSDSDGTEFEEMLQDDIASPEQLQEIHCMNYVRLGFLLFFLHIQIIKNMIVWDSIKKKWLGMREILMSVKSI